MTEVLRQTPWIVSREVLLEDAIEDFLGEVTRQHPWHQDEYEALFESLGEHLEGHAGKAVLDKAAPHRPVRTLLFTDYSNPEARAWLETLEPSESTLAVQMLEEFEHYLESFGWNAQYLGQ